jgi:hypothetical protein
LKFLGLVVILLCAAALWFYGLKHVVVEPPSMDGAAHRNAQYVRTHKCTVAEDNKATIDYSSAEGREVVSRAYKGYTCPGFTMLERVYIYDDEEQP